MKSFVPCKSDLKLLEEIDRETAAKIGEQE